jgi:hypothetical protein
MVMAVGLQFNLNRVIGNTMTGPTWYEAQQAANVWANTPTYLDLLGALNYKAGTSGLGLNAVCNLLAGTTGLDSDGASEFFS